MNELVFCEKKEVFTDSMVIANETGNQHESVVRLISNNIDRMRRFGEINFTDLKSGKRGRPTRIYKLNEPQATLLITFLDNTDKVADFKMNLVEQFYKMKQVLFEKSNFIWVEQRKQGKLTRQAETDVIKRLVEYAKEQGSEHSQMLYTTYSKLANKMAGITDRDFATLAQLNELSFIENIILNQIRVGMEREMHYKDIYKDCKKQIETFKDVAYLNAG